MSFEVTLQDIAEAAEKKYGDVVVPVDDSTKVVLRNPLRLSKAEREQISELQDSLNEEGADQEEVLKEILFVVADNKSKARKMVSAFKGDLTQLVTVFTIYQDRVQLGEASPSQD